MNYIRKADAPFVLNNASCMNAPACVCVFVCMYQHPFHMHITPATLVCMAVIEQGVLYLNRDLTVADAPLGAPLSGRAIKSCMGKE